MKELELEIRVRNNLLKERRDKLGLSQKRMADCIGISLAYWQRLESMNPSQTLFTRRDNEWRPVIKAIARYFEVEPEELFPESVRKVEANKATRKIDGPDLMLLMGNEPKYLVDEIAFNPEEKLIRKENKELLLKFIETLTDKQKIVFREFHFNGRKASDIAKEYKVSHMTIHNHAQNIMRKWRSFKRKDDDKDFIRYETIKQKEHNRKLKAYKKDEDYWQEVDAAIERAKKPLEPKLPKKKKKISRDYSRSWMRPRPYYKVPDISYFDDDIDNFLDQLIEDMDEDIIDAECEETEKGE